MGWDGNGNFVRTDGTRTGANVFAQQKTADVNVNAALHDAHANDIATGLEACLNRDGENSPSTDIPMGSNAFTGLAAGTAAGESVRWEQFFSAESELTISSGAITPTTPHHTVDTESDAATDVLDTITATNISDGEVVWLSLANSARVVYCSTAGNIAHPVRLQVSRPTGFILKGSTFYCIDAMHLLDSQTASTSATLDFTRGLGSVYRHYLFVLSAVVPATDNVALYLRTSTDGGSNYAEAASDYQWSNILASAGDSVSLDSDAADSEIQLAAGIGSDTGEGLSGQIWFDNPSGTALNKMFRNHISFMRLDATLRQSSGSGCRAAVADIDGARFLMSSGNIESGTIDLYAMRV